MANIDTPRNNAVALRCPFMLKTVKFETQKFYFQNEDLIRNIAP